MNWFKKQSQNQLNLFKEKVEEKPNVPKIEIWGLNQHGILSVVINGKLYKYENVKPHEEKYLQQLLNHKSYKKLFNILKEISQRVKPFARNLPY